MLPAARSIIFLLRTQVQPVHPEFTEGIAIFFEIVAVTGVPVESACLFIEGFDTALDSDVDLRSADIEEWIVNDFPLKTKMLLAVEIGVNYGDDLAAFHFNLGSGAVVGFEMRQDFHRFEVFTVHFPRAGAMRQGDHAVMGKGRVI